MTNAEQRRKFLIASAGFMGLGVANGFPICSDAKNQICNVTRLYSIDALGVVIAKDLDDIRRVLRSEVKPISIGGGRYSMGGQTAVANGVQIDMRSFNQLVWLKPDEKIVRVQAGMRWRDLQSLIDPYDLSIQTMQSYSNFTVGGALSVNCHGRYVGHGGVIHSVRSIQLVLPDGQALEANRQENTEIFYSAIGGYGAVGIITEVELNLDENFKIERSTARISLMEYPEWFESNVKSNPLALLHNADLIPPVFNAPFCITWSRSFKPLTMAKRLVPKGQKYRTEQSAMWMLTELPGGDKLRKAVQKLETKPAVVWRNHEASLDVAQLEPRSRNLATYVLQEYFVPVSQFKNYAAALSKFMTNMNTHTVNISIRHSKADNLTLMSWAKEEVFCFVVYYKQQMQTKSEMEVMQFTRAMIDLALKHNGRYYLPYQPHATQTQFEQAYPEAAQLRKLRKELGSERLSNAMWMRHKV